MRKLIIFPFRIIAFAFLPPLMLLHLIGSILLGLSSILTNLLAAIFLLGTAAGWLTHQPSLLTAHTAGIGIFFALAPYIGEWLLGRLTALTLLLLDFVFS